MRFHDAVALTGVVLLSAGGGALLFWSGHRSLGAVAAVVGLGLVAWGASYL